MFLKDKSGVCITYARKQTHQLLPRAINSFPHYAIHNSCKSAKHVGDLGQISLQLDAIASLKAQ